MSLTIRFLTNPSFSQLTSMHFYAWKKGLKTGMYYLRTRPAANAIQFTIDSATLKSAYPLLHLNKLIPCRGKAAKD